MKRRRLSIQNRILRLMKQGTEKTMAARWLPFAPILRKPSLPDYVTVIIATGVLIAGVTLAPWPGNAGKVLEGQQPILFTSTADNKAIEDGIIILTVRIKKANEENKKQRNNMIKKQNQPQSAQGRAMLQVALEQNNFATKTLKLVEEAKKRVESAPNPAAKMVALRDVEDKMRLVQKHQQRANTAASPVNK